MSATIMQRAARFFGDTMLNLVSSLGTVRDKATHNEFTFNPLSPEQLSFAYRGDWVARKVVDVPAKDATRMWRKWHASADQIEKIEAEEKRLGLQVKLKRALVRGRLYGGGALIVGTRMGDPAQPLDPEEVKKDGLKYVHVVSRYDLGQEAPVRDVTSELFGTPEYYSVNSDVSGIQKIHASRVIRMVPCEIPDSVGQVTDGWGDSVLQAVYDAVMNVASSTSGVAALIQEAKIDVVNIPGLMAQISDPDYKSRLSERLLMAGQMKSMVNTLVLDGEEKWDRIEANFGGLPDVMKLYLLVASGAADIPATRMLGQSAVGLGATGEGDLRNYYDSVRSDQSTTLSPVLDPLDELLIRSALGSRPPEVHYEWNSLWQPTPSEKATYDKTRADTFKVDVDAAVIEPEILRQIRINMLIEDGTYPGIEEAVEEYEASGAGVDEDDSEAQDQFNRQKGNVPPDPDNDDVDPAGEKKVVGDAEPRTLYVRRDVKNAEAIADHYRAQGVEVQDVSEWHVTVAFSKAPVDWMKVGSDWHGRDDGKLTVPPGGARLHERLGPEGAKDAVVLLFNSSHLAWRHREICEAGATWDFPDYQPHVTLLYDTEGDRVDHEALEPWRGVIELGPEIFEEVK